MKRLIRRLVPKFLLRWYHHLRGWLAALRYGFPGRKLIVIAVTGTNGKTTTVNWIGQLLQMSGQAVGWISTATICLRSEERLNATKMTTANPEFLQRTLADMVRRGCRYAVIEASSEGLAQGRLNGIPIRGAVFTNLTPEHIESHGTFENYARAKEALFQKVARGADKFIVVNADDPTYLRYARYRTNRVIGCTLQHHQSQTNIPLLHASDIHEQPDAIAFRLGENEATLPFRGLFNLMNALEAVAALKMLGFEPAATLPQLARLQPVPGRLELLELNTPYRVLVDYAPEPASLAALYTVIPQLHPQRIIHVFGSAGGGRDRARRPVLGRFVAERADVAIVTNEDPYDEPPDRIMADIMAGVKLAQPKKAKVEQIADRRMAIARALDLAQPDDLVVITGKASEQWIMGPRGQKTPWDDRRVVREIARHG